MKKSFVLYQDYKTHISLLSQEQKGYLLDAIFEYNEGNLIKLDPIVEMAFSFIKTQMDRDSDKYAIELEKRRSAGRKGGLAKASSAKQCLASLADNETDIVTVTVNDINKDIHEIFDFWKVTMNHPNAKLDDRRRQKIKKALVLGYSKDDLIDAVRGCAMTSFNMGDNDNHKVYDDIELILRNSSNIERFINNSKGKIEFVKKSKKELLREKNNQVVERITRPTIDHEKLEDL